MAKKKPLESGLAGATLENRQKIDLVKDFSKDLQSKIIEYAIKRINNGYSEKGVKSYLYNLRNLARNGADLHYPENVKATITKMKVSNRTKDILAGAYGSFLRFLGESWEKPKYVFSEKMPFIPLESEIDQLISGCSKTISTFLKVCKDTGARKGEIANLKWTDVDFQRQIIAINEPEKGSNSRQIKVSLECIKMIDKLLRKRDRIFNINSVERQFFRQRKKVSRKLESERIRRIGFHTLRHWKATTTYHKTLDIRHVQYLLGHKNILNTVRYINIEKTIFQENSDEFHVKVARTMEEARKLLGQGYKHALDIDGVKLLTKRK